MLITLTAADKGGDHTIGHDLNFQAEQYESKHTVVCLTMISLGLWPTGLPLTFMSTTQPDFQKSQTRTTCHAKRIRTHSWRCERRQRRRECEEEEEAR